MTYPWCLPISCCQTQEKLTPQRPPLHHSGRPGPSVWTYRPQCVGGCCGCPGEMEDRRKEGEIGQRSEGRERERQGRRKEGEGGGERQDGGANGRAKGRNESAPFHALLPSLFCLLLQPFLCLCSCLYSLFHFPLLPERLQAQGTAAAVHVRSSPRHKREQAMYPRPDPLKHIRLCSLPQPHPYSLHNPSAVLP